MSDRRRRFDDDEQPPGPPPPCCDPGEPAGYRFTWSRFDPATGDGTSITVDLTGDQLRRVLGVGEPGECDETQETP